MAEEMRIENRGLHSYGVYRMAFQGRWGGRDYRRAKLVGNIHKLAGKWLWYTQDKTKAGYVKTLTGAKREIKKALKESIYD